MENRSFSGVYCVVLAAILCLPACEKADHARRPTLDKSKFEGIGSTGGVELLGAGQDPKTKLRFRFDNLRSERLEMTMEVDTKTALDGADMDSKMAMSYFITTDVTDLTNPETTQMSLVIDDVRMDQARSSPMFRDSMGNLMTMLKGMSGSFRVTSRGQIEDVTYDLSSVPERMRPFLDQMQESLKQITTSFPEEPVGIGATWRVYQVFKMQGIKIRQQVENKLVKIDGSMVYLGSQIAQEAEMQLAKMAGLPSEAKAKVSSFWSTGTGTLVLDLEGLVPVRGASKIKTRGEFHLDLGNHEVAMKTTTSTKVGMRRLQ